MRPKGLKEVKKEYRKQERFSWKIVGLSEDQVQTFDFDAAAGAEEAKRNDWKDYE